jgi:mxaJ protein
MSANTRADRPADRRGAGCGGHFPSIGFCSRPNHSVSNMRFALSIAFVVAMNAAGSAAAQVRNTAVDENAPKAVVVAPDPSVLRVCAAVNELPMSKNDGSGFENKIAVVLAEAMGKTAKFAWFPKESIYLVRDQLDIKACDVVMGIDTGDPRVLTSRPYYRAPYVFILRKDSKLDVTSWDSLDLKKAARIGFTPGSPPQVMMEKTGLFQDHFNYMHSLSNFKDKRNKFTRVPPDRMVGEVADGTADVAVNFAPEVARYAKDNGNVKLVVIPDDNVRDDGQKVPHHFDQSLAVRKDDQALVDQLNVALEKSRAKIDEILKDEGIPLLSQSPRS